MKRALLFILSVSFFSVLHAQPWMPAHNNGPVKLSDIITAYKNANPGYKGAEKEEEEGHQAGKIVKEGKDYQFERWVWYWENHLDSNGYLVSPLKTYQEWQNYLQLNGQQYASKTTSNQSNWVFQGPDNSLGGYSGLGRINVVAFHPTDVNTFWIGSAAGGPWKTTNGGATWAPVYNNVPAMGVSDIDFNPQNPNTIYVCTGDGDASDTYSIGVLKSTDGGNTWNPTGLAWTTDQYYTACNLVINPLDTNSLMVSSNQGVYKSLNGGATWTQVLTGNMHQVIYNPADTNLLYATGYDWNINGNNAEVYISHNGGYTWQAATTSTNVTRFGVAVSASNPSVVKAISVRNDNSGLEGFYSSSDSGASFTKIIEGSDCTNNLLNWDLTLTPSSCGGQAWYDLCIAIDPGNANNVVIGGVNTYYSTDGGNTWTIATQWYTGLTNVSTVHADKHFVGYNPLTPSVLFQGCDGGVYKTADPLGQMWTDLTNGIGITEFYRIAVDNGVPFALGGAQDNGTKMVDNGTYYDIAGGDGAQCRIDYSDPTNTWYVSYEEGSFDITTDGGNTFTDISGNIPGQPSGDWITPFVMHPQDPSQLLVGYDQLFWSNDQGNSWTNISPVFSPNDNINTIAISTKNPNYIYLSIDNNNYGSNDSIYYSSDFGNTWNLAQVPYSGAQISCIAVDPKNEHNLWVTFSGYSSSKVALYNSSTHVWTLENGSLPNIPVNWITIDSETSTKYIGTATAVFYRDTTMANWALYNTNLPAVEINDLEINYTTGELWAGTFGRGMWKTVKREGPSGISIVPYANDVITIAPDPNKGNFSISTSNKNFIGKNVTVQLIASDGRVAWQQNKTFDNNGNMSINAAGIAKGVYICQVTGDMMAARARVVIF